MCSKIFRYGLPVLALLVLLVPTAFAQQTRGPGRFADAEHRYDPETVATVTGTVEEVLLRPGRGGATGLHLSLALEYGEHLEVVVGPTFYVYPEGFEAETGDIVTVTGSRLTVNGEPMLMAREIQVGDHDLTLRDETGMPAWRGQGPRTEGTFGAGPRPGMGQRGRGRMGGRGHHQDGHRGGCGHRGDGRGSMGGEGCRGCRSGR